MIVAAALAAPGCGAGRPSELAGVYSVVVDVSPSRPTVDRECTVKVTIRDDRGREPIAGARVQFEGHMAHPGMAAVVVQASEQAEGVYVARMSFPMAGDWVVIATAAVRDGRRVHQQINLQVRPAD